LILSILLTALIVFVVKFIVTEASSRRVKVYRMTDPHSFPSGHAARAMMIAAVMLGLDKPGSGLLLLSGHFWSASPVGMGVHYLSDVLA
jgi:undecaprenyl-diphosphatase